MAEFPAMPLWTDRYLADTGHLTDLQHGVYLRLLILLWRAPAQRIPNDDDWLNKRFGDMPTLRLIVHEFCKCDGNWIWNDAARREFQYVAERREKHRDLAKRRWDKEKAVCNGNAALAYAPTPTPTPTQEVKILGGVAPKPARPTKGCRLPVDWVPSLEGKSFADGKIGTDRADEELEKFRDYWCAMPGQRGTKLDWNRTWNNWVRNTGGRFNGNGRDKSLKEKYADALHKLGSSETSANVIGFLPKLHSD